MKHSVSILMLLSLALTSINWVTSGYGNATTPAANEVSNNTCTAVGRLVSVQGKVRLQRQGRSDYHPTSVGAVLCVGDLLWPAKGATVVVHCTDPDANFWTVPSGRLSSAVNGCPPPDEPIHTITGPIVPTRNPVARHIPYIISPDDTWLLNSKPKLRWQAVPGASIYVVRVSGPGLNWVTEVSTTSVVYAGELPLKPLKKGYLLTVEADNGESPAWGTFGLLDQSKATRVRATAERINRQNLSDEAKTLALADLYIGQGLIAEAIELLEAVVASGNNTVAVFHVLGDLYARVESFPNAEGNYLKAVELATTALDIEGQGAAATRLGELYKVLGNFERAAYWLKQAKKGY